MKLFALGTVAAASTSEWMMNAWWEEATSVFNFASGNFEDFKPGCEIHFEFTKLVKRKFLKLICIFVA